jgi:hypothetical protein
MDLGKQFTFYLYEELELKPIQGFVVSICNLDWNSMINGRTCEQASSKHQSEGNFCLSYDFIDVQFIYVWQMF